jgi:hypothetical protein
VPQRVIDAVSNYYRTANANEGGPFATSVRSDATSPVPGRRLPTCTGPQHLRDQVRLQHDHADYDINRKSEATRDTALPGGVLGALGGPRLERTRVQCDLACEEGADEDDR